MTQDPGETPTPLDALALALQQRRAEAGSPSYAEIVTRIATRRRARGVPEAEARPGRTTVYDAFRTGRRRMDTGLLLEIVRALGADEIETARWASACRQAHQAAVATAAPVAAVPPPESSPPGPTPASGRRRVASLALFLVACVGLNLVGRVIVDLLGLPVYQDMNGTAVAAITLGPWWGALVGVATNVGGVATSGGVSLAFVPVNVVGALLWGYGMRRLGTAISIPRYFLLNVVVAVGCTTVAVPIIVLFLGGLTGNGADEVGATVMAISGGSMVVSVVLVNLLTSLADKVLAGFLALTVVESLPWLATSWRLTRPTLPAVRAPSVGVDGAE